MTVGSVFEVMEMGLTVDAIASPVLFEEDTGLVDLAIEPEDEDKYHSCVPVALRQI
ncbi:MAG: hypothetical protein WBV73_18155 [Phormidium sp.]